MKTANVWLCKLKLINRLDRLTANALAEFCGFFVSKIWRGVFPADVRIPSRGGHSSPRNSTMTDRGLPPPRAFSLAQTQLTAHITHLPCWMSFPKSVKSKTSQENRRAHGSIRPPQSLYFLSVSLGTARRSPAAKPFSRVVESEDLKGEGSDD